jgi:hypothetical protein
VRAQEWKNITPKINCMAIPALRAKTEGNGVELNGYEVNSEHTGYDEGLSQRYYKNM